MSTKKLQNIAQGNLKKWQDKIYPGRVIMNGLDETGKNIIEFYAIMGRQPSSRERYFQVDVDNNDRLLVLPTDPKQLNIPEAKLLFYTGMQTFGTYNVVTNGSHTDIIIEGFMDAAPLIESLRICTYEPDPPNNTCRIAGVCYYWGSRVMGELCVLRKSLFNNDCDYLHYVYHELTPGYGHIISTYSDDGKPLPDGEPLPPWTGEPDLMPIEGGPDEILETYRTLLNEEYFVAAAIKVIPINHSERARIQTYSKYAPIITTD